MKTKNLSLLVSLFVVIAVVVSFVITTFAANVIQPRYIAYDMVRDYAEFATGPVNTPDGSCGNGISFNIDEGSIGASLKLECSRGKLYGAYLPRGAEVNYFSKSEFGNNVVLKQGKLFSRILVNITYPTEKNGGQKVLIGYQGVYYYINRNMLGVSRP